MKSSQLVCVVGCFALCGVWVHTAIAQTSLSAKDRTALENLAQQKHKNAYVATRVHARPPITQSAMTTALARRYTMSAAAAAKLNQLAPKVQRTLALGQNWTNPSVANRPPDWNKRVCNNSRFLQGADFEWTSVLDPSESGVESRVVGVSGLVVNQHVSGTEVWYTHPFDVDWNANLALDPGFDFIFAPGTPGSDSETKSAVDSAANILGFPIQNALHVEFDSGLIPASYRASEGQEVAIYGRWIVDCGHTNFTTEIHSPLLFVKSDGGDNDPWGTTQATVTSRSFMVKQTFGGQTLRNKLLNDVISAYSDPEPISGFIRAGLTQFSARPDIATTPFGGIQLLNFVFRPQFARMAPNDKLLVRYQFYVRPGVAIQVANNGDDSITVWVVMNDVSYQAATLPSSQNVHHTAADIRAAEPDVGALLDGLYAGGALTFPWGDIAVAKGWDTDFYPQVPVTPEGPLPPFFFVTLVNQRPGIVVQTTDPRPIFGTIEMKWERISKPESTLGVVPLPQVLQHH